MTIGDRIKKRRLELNMSQSELARKAGYKSRSSINKMESDDRGATREQLIKIARALHVTPSYLMGWEEVAVAGLTALQEEIIEKTYALTPENQQTLLGIIDTLLQAQIRKEKDNEKG